MLTIVFVLLALCLGVNGFQLQAIAPRFAKQGLSSSCVMKAQLIPRGREVLFDFSLVASPSKAEDWGNVAHTFDVAPGKVLLLTVAKFPLGSVIEEDETEENILFTEVPEGSGADAAGIKQGDVLRALTTLTLPKQANLVKEAIGALYVLDSMNPNLFGQTLEALVANASPNGGSGKAILVVERNAGDNVNADSED